MARVYDLAMTHKLDADDFFIHRVQQHCAEAGLNFFLIEPLWAEAFLARLEAGEIRVRVLLNMHSEHHQPGELYHRLVRAAHTRGAAVIDPPDTALAAFDKAQLHPRLVSAGFAVPPTIVVSRADAAGFQLHDTEREALGTPFVIKPGMGYGKRGVILDALTGADLARSMTAWPGADYLLQKRVTPRTINGEPAYFRVYHVFGTVWCSWWNCYTDRYRLVTPVERLELGLAALEEIVIRLAALTGMNFFSSEIAHTEAGEFVLIDYVNDQCHLLTQSADPKIGVPDALVAAIALRLVGGAAEIIARSK